MVSLRERNEIALRAKKDAEMQAIYAFIFNEPFDYTSASNFPHAELLRAVAGRDVKAFREQVAEFQRRRASEGSSWYENDSLIFLLLVGCERFQIDPSFLDRILTLRDRNANPTPKRVNEVFRALMRKEYGMEGQFSFIKIPILFLGVGLSLNYEAAQKAYNELIQPTLFNDLSPFLQLLALRAFDLVLFERQPQPYENFEVLLGGIEKLKERARLRDVARLIWAMPYKWLFIVIIAIVPFSYGVGEKALVVWHEASSARSRPKVMTVASSNDAQHYPLSVVRALAKQAVADQQLKAGEHLNAIAVETSRLLTPAPKFSVEAYFNKVDPVDGFAVLIKQADGGPTQTVLPVQINHDSLRAFLPPSEADSYVVFVVILREPNTLDPSRVASTITLRSLD